jgi:hypothetical protein
VKWPPPRGCRPVGYPVGGKCEWKAPDMVQLV